jgi:hypothetical protein
VFALRLNRRKLAENPLDLIRRKFSIDACFSEKKQGRRAASTISKPYLARSGNRTFTIYVESVVSLQRKDAANVRSLAAGPRALAFA